MKVSGLYGVISHRLTDLGKLKGKMKISVQFQF